MIKAELVHRTSWKTYYNPKTEQVMAIGYNVSWDKSNIRTIYEIKDKLVCYQKFIFGKEKLVLVKDVVLYLYKLDTSKRTAYYASNINKDQVTII